MKIESLEKRTNEFGTQVKCPVPRCTRWCQLPSIRKHIASYDDVTHKKFYLENTVEVTKRVWK